MFFSLMEQISIMFAESRETEIVLAPVVQAGLDALKVHKRSRVTCSNHVLAPEYRFTRQSSLICKNGSPGLFVFTLYNVLHASHSKFPFKSTFIFYSLQVFRASCSYFILHFLSLKLLEN